MLRATAPNQVWSWAIILLPITIWGIKMYLYLVIDAWSRKVVAWNVDERENLAIAGDLVSSACIREQISKDRGQPLILHADNRHTMRAGTLEKRLEELGILRFFSRPRVSNDTRTLGRGSGQRNTDVTTPDDLPQTRKRPANVSRHLWTGTTTGIGTAASSSRSPNDITLVWP